MQHVGNSSLPFRIFDLKRDVVKTHNASRKVLSTPVQNTIAPTASKRVFVQETSETHVCDVVTRYDEEQLRQLHVPGAWLTQQIWFSYTDREIESFSHGCPSKNFRSPQDMRFGGLSGIGVVR